VIRITVAIATYNRRKLVEACVRRVLDLELPEWLDVIVVDNNSDDGTYTSLLQICDQKIGVYQNDVNLGFSGNFLQCITKSKGDYVLWLSDEDAINLEGLSSIKSDLDKNEYCAVVGDYYRYIDGYNLVPYRVNVNRDATIEDLWGCSHLPGILWNKESTIAGLVKFHEYSDKYPEIAKYYPQFFPLIKFFRESRVIFHSNYFSYQVEYQSSTHVSSKRGERYYYVSPRWQQLSDLIRYVNNEFSSGAIEDLNFKDSMKDVIARSAYELLMDAMKVDNPTLAEGFKRGGSLRHRSKILIKRMIRLVRILKINPTYVVGKIKGKVFHV